MIKVEIPGREELRLENLVFDFNGTIAINGKILESIKPKLLELSKTMNIYVITADTYGLAKEECEKLNLKVITIPRGCAGDAKGSFIRDIDSKKTAAIGNGFNDIEMCKEAEFSVAVIEGEGAYSKLIFHSDIVTKNIDEALDLFLITNHIKADLRW
ncbi:HAD family hydrolase [Terrisporobacter sp.]